jgi:hypothetical protein
MLYLLDSTGTLKFEIFLKQKKVIQNDVFQVCHFVLYSIAEAIFNSVRTQQTEVCILSDESKNITN